MSTVPSRQILKTEYDEHQKMLLMNASGSEDPDHVFTYGL